ncbi:MAG: family 10 glycosylhydrolase [Christensenellaceae bacterium]|jgi:uncharacterized lipoprotein YddW (UPF0748 family)|nr:family 10 glycosylhydrolase [Christensenellaceae bacterium]
MKRAFAVFAVAMLLCGCSSRPNNNGVANPNSVAPNPSGAFLRGAWVTTIWNIDYPKAPTTDSTKLKTEIDQIVARAKGLGLNALFFQVRPCADAFYNSDIFPWSKWLTETQGLAPSNAFDPLEYIIGRAHTHNIQLHAWINPYRVTALATEKLVATHPARLAPELTINVDGKLYWNPGEPHARDLVINGVREIVENYAVDGIHFDDYFYPEGITTHDFGTWLNFGDGDNIADWRRSNVDQLVHDTHKAIKEIAPGVVFGVSPSGIWANKSHNGLGSDTQGFESYYEIFADSRGWVKKGFVDYIAPQIYWRTGQLGSDFQIILDWWRDVVESTTVKLYTGIGAYRYFGANEYETQKQLATEIGDGFIMFSFGDL